MSESQIPDEVAPLFRPFHRPGLSLDNRIVMAPMTRCFSPDGVPGPDVAAYYRRRAEGGVGLILTEGTWIPHPSASNEARVPRFHGADALAGWSHVVAEVHEAGGRIMPQLWHTGLVRKPSIDNIYDGSNDLETKFSPSGYVLPGEKVGRPMTEADIEAIVEAYAEATASAERLGFDGVEIHAAHGYLVDQFFWHETNRREDRWGGAELGARTAFGVALVRACRARVGRDFPIILRFSQWKQQDYAAKLAHTPQELEAFLLPLAEAGVDLFHCSQRRFWEPEFPGSDLNLAGWTKRLTGLPTITVGSVGLETEFLASMFSPDSVGTARLGRLVEMLERGDFDLVAVGRALLVDPAWAEKVRQGEFAALRPYTPAVLAALT